MPVAGVEDRSYLSSAAELFYWDQAIAAKKKNKIEKLLN